MKTELEQLKYYRSMAKVTKADLNDAVVDDAGVAYSKDGKRLLKGGDVKDYIVREGTEVICNKAFGFECVGDIQFPQSLRYIGNNAFNSSVSFTLPEGLLGIGKEAFCFAAYCKELIIPNSVIYIGESAFLGSYIKRLVIGNGLKRIEENTFRDIWAKDVIIGTSVTYIGFLAFADNYINEIVIPPAVRKLSGNPFGGNIKRIVSQSKNFFVRDDILYTANGKELIACISKKQELKIPSSVEQIRPCAFMHSDVESVILPNSVTSIGVGAFLGARTKSVRLPKGLRKIGEETFYGSKIETIVIPNSVTEIGHEAFATCKDLKAVQMSKNISTIGEGAFAYCMKLESMRLPKKVINIGDKAFFCCHGLKRHEEEIGIKICID